MAGKSCCCGSSEKADDGGIDLNRSRKCTDVPCLLVFVAFWVGLIFICAVSAVQGDIWRLIYGTDSFGNVCGQMNNPWNPNGTNVGIDLTNRPYLFPMDILHPFDSGWICVEKCPNRLLASPEQLQLFAIENQVHLCYDSPISEYNNTEKFSSTPLGPCPVLPVFASAPILRRCIPQFASELAEDTMQSIFGYLNNISAFQQCLQDVIAARRELIALCAIAFILALMMVFLVRFLATVTVYLIFALVAASALAVTGTLWYAYVDLYWNLETTDFVTNHTRVLVSETKNEHTLLIFAIASTGVTAFILFCVFCLKRQVSLLSDLFHESGRCLESLPCLLFQPLWTFVVLLIFIIYWCVVTLLMATAADPKAEERVVEGPPHVAMIFVDFDRAHPVRYFWWFHLIGLVWTCEFILAAQQMVVASAVGMWYFEKDKSQLRCPIFKSIKNLFLYHLGSIALGSFIITLVKLPRLFLLYMEQKLKGAANPLAKCCLKCMQCCLFCVERCCKYWHHNAYTIIAIQGQSFCPAAIQAFDILTSNSLSVAAINSVGDFVLFLGKIGVTSLTVLIGIFMLKANPDLHYYAIPLLLAGIVAFFISHCFFSVYEMVIDTLFLCFCEDHRLQREAEDATDSGAAAHNGAEGASEFRILYSPETLIELVEKHSKRKANGFSGKKKNGESVEESIPMDPIPA